MEAIKLNKDMAGDREQNAAGKQSMEKPEELKLGDEETGVVKQSMDKAEESEAGDMKENVTVTQFMDIPEEVVEGHILPLLKWNDLLRMRRVSKDLNKIIQKFMVIHPKLAPEIEINETNKSLHEFKSLGIPSTKFFFDNDESRYEFFDNPDLQDFVKLYGSQITHVRVTEFAIFGEKSEMDFYRALTNLESLEVIRCELGIGRYDEWKGIFTPDPATEDYRMPDTILRLKSLKIGSQDGVKEYRNIFFVWSDLVSRCQLLEYAMIPFKELWFPVEGTGRDGGELLLEYQPGALGFAFKVLIKDVIEARSELFPEKPNLKVYDFEHYYIPVKHERLERLDASGRVDFLDLCQECNVHGIKLKNVVASWIPETVNPPFGLGHPTISLVNLHAGVFSLDMVNLEQVHVKASSRCVLTMDSGEHPPSWPSLKNLSIVFDSEDVERVMHRTGPGQVAYFQVKSGVLFNFFFQTTSRPALTDLDLVWKEAGMGAVPLVNDIISACPNLRKLTLVNWAGTKKGMCDLWNGLPALEEVCLDGCKNVALVGKDPNNPVFLKLKNLKRLSLKNLDQMHKITDTLFKLVIKSMNLTHLTLTSAKPLVKITPSGIRSLLTGNFANSIEKFPFTGWSLKNCSKKDFLKLGSEFRSHDMI